MGRLAPLHCYTIFWSEKMTTKEFLRQYQESCRKARLFKLEYEREAELVGSVRSALGGDGMPHGTGVNKSVEDKAIRLSEKFAKWRKAEIEALEVRQIVFDLISEIPGKEGDILYERYINARKWEEICVIVHLSWNGTHKAHKRALKLVDQRIKNRV